MVVEKRIDILFERNIRKRAYIQFDDNDFSEPPVMRYDNKLYFTSEEFKDATHYETLIVSDEACFKILKKYNYIVQSSNRKKETLNLSINKNLVERIRNDAYDQEQSISTVVEQILKEYYGK